MRLHLNKAVLNDHLSTGLPLACPSIWYAAESYTHIPDTRSSARNIDSRFGGYLREAQQVTFCDKHETLWYARTLCRWTILSAIQAILKTSLRNANGRKALVVSISHNSLQYPTLSWLAASGCEWLAQESGKGFSGARNGKVVTIVVALWSWGFRLHWLKPW